eukprot:2167858-Rhodomonas_salina.1
MLLSVYALSGTDLAYAAVLYTRCRVLTWRMLLRDIRYCRSSHAHLPTSCPAYCPSGTLLSRYARATPCPVLT